MAHIRRVINPSIYLKTKHTGKPMLFPLPSTKKYNYWKEGCFKRYSDFRNPKNSNYNKPWVYTNFVQKALFGGLILEGFYYRRAFCGSK